MLTGFGDTNTLALATGYATDEVVSYNGVLV